MDTETISYAGVVFLDRLEAQYAAFFDLVRWTWEYLPAGFSFGDEQLIPSFYVTFPCGHSDCSGSHSLLVIVRPTNCLDVGLDTPWVRHSYGVGVDGPKPVDAVALFGNHPGLSWWEMGHGSGGGDEEIAGWVYDDLNKLWGKASQMLGVDRQEKS